MIAFLTGRVAGKAPGFALLEVGGVGYKLAMTTGSLAALPALGDEVTIWTHLYVREDDLSLFGFESEDEKFAFEQLITVSGIGPKVALAVLSSLSPDAFSSAVAAEDADLLATVPGIGKKTGQRIILDLKDKLAAQAPGLATGSTGGSRAALAEASDALLGMGFSAAEVAIALKGAEGADAQHMLKQALKRLGGGA
jgi:Holliday junction DNA helicase RuvA